MIRRYKLKTVFPQKKFQINYEKDLTEEQLPIVTSSGGPVLVIAGAGSGKTRTITYRVAYLVESGIAPDRILLVTFTNKAAREMIRRVENLLKINLKHLWAGTFHHIGNMILRHHARVLGYKENYAILDEADSKDLLEACIPELGKKIEKRMFPKGDVLKDILSFAINSRVSIEESVLTKASHFVDLIPDINKIAEIYERRKKKQNLMDFDDLLLNWDRLLKENKEIKEKYAKKFLHTLVDEYQDTNVIQAEIIDNLASVNRNVMVVGDDSQSIYSFRGAYFKNIIEFPKRYPDVKIYKLEINHRSTPQILNLANESIKQAKYRFEKKLKAVKKGGVKPGLAPLSDIYEQAAFVAQRILELRDQGVPLSQIAVLYRSHYHSLELQMELMRMGIPFVVRSGLRFFEEAHIKDVLAHLKIFHNPLDELAWKRVLKLMPGIGIRLSDKIWKFLSASGDSLSAIKSDRLAKELPSAAKDSLADLVSLLRILGKLLDSPA